MTDFLNRVADVLDKLASTPQTAPPAQVRVDLEKVASLRSRYQEATGDEMPLEAAVKLASDPEVARVTERLAFAQTAPTPLGAPGEKTAYAPRSKEELRRDTDQKFVDGLFSRR